MAIWVEIHCDARMDGADECGTPRCWTHRGEQPGLLTQSVSTTQKALAYLAQDSIRRGWKKDRTGNWICPECIKMKAENVQHPTD